LSRIDKTNPFWVKLAHGDLAVVEKHDHADGHCDLPDPFDAFAFSRLTTRCRRDFSTPAPGSAAALGVMARSIPTALSPSAAAMSGARPSSAAAIGFTSTRSGVGASR
jgi:hypothetical protein